MNLDNTNLPEKDKRSIESMLSKSPHNPPLLEDIRGLMDNVWDEIGCNNENPNLDKVSEYYAHPVWLLSGMFKEQDAVPIQHRNAISDWICKNNFKHVLDYGGGFGTLARLIAKKDSNILIDIYEPYPSEFAQLKAEDYSNIQFTSSIDEKYDCLVSTDVLEHVTEPLKLFSEMVDNTKMNGYLIIANHFYPVIKCHLPSTFHLRYTFKIFTHIMGLHFVGPCEGSHATIYQKKKNVALNWQKINKYERISRMIYPFLDTAHRVYNKYK